MKIYGPYTRKDGRQIIVLYDGNSTTTMSYPKYLVEQMLGRKLSDTETVDHIDEDFTNNSPDNLRVLEKPGHIKDDVLRRQGKTLTCVWCDTVFECSGKSLHNRSRGKSGPFCSRKCGGEYGALLQHNKIEALPPAEIYEKIYYKNKDHLKIEPIIRKIDSGDGDIGETFDSGNTEGTQ